MRRRWRIDYLAAVLVLLLFSCAHAAPVMYDLSYQGAVETVNGAIYQQWDEPNPMGSGTIDAFLKIQGTGAQRGYNTDGTPEFDTQSFGSPSGGLRTLLLSDIPVYENGGGSYREFCLDINQNQTHQILSLDDVEIYLETTADIDSYPSDFSVPIYDLDMQGEIIMLS